MRPDPISPSAARHCRRQARARRGQAIPEPLCLFGRHQNLPRLSLVLYTRSNAAGTRRSTAAGQPHLRRPCSAVEPPPPSTSRRAKTTIRCGFSPSPFFPHFPLASGQPHRRETPSQFLPCFVFPSRDPKLKETKLSGVKLQNVHEPQNSKLKKFLENRIKIIKMQTKMFWNP